MHKVMAAALTGLALVGLAGTASADTGLTWPPQDVTPVHKTKAELEKQAAEFSERQEKTFPRTFRGAADVTPGNWGGESEGVFDGMQYMGNVVSFRYRGEDTQVYTQVNAPGEFVDSPEELCKRDKCVGEFTDHRGGVTVLTEFEPFNIAAAYNFRPNGEVVWAQAWRADVYPQLAAVASDRAYTFTR
ncbi:hypothetical protein [Lentzea fradiae]|nr:hypothetical protein [Lentzea fradiae]